MARGLRGAASHNMKKDKAQEKPVELRRTKRARVQTQRFTSEVNETLDKVKACLEPAQTTKTMMGGGTPPPPEPMKVEEETVTYNISLNEKNWKQWKDLKEEYKFTDDNDLFTHLAHQLKTSSLENLLDKGDPSLAARGPYVIPKDEIHLNHPNKNDSSAENDENLKPTSPPPATVPSTPADGASTLLKKDPKPCEDDQPLTDLKKKVHKPRKRKRNNLAEPNKDVDPSERILKRKKISQYDCRKTPSGGIVEEEKKNPGEFQPKGEEQGKNVEPSSKPMSTSSSPPPPPTTTTTPTATKTPNSLSPKWCRNCDARHHKGPTTCPFRSAKLVLTDSVIDFSNKSGSEAGKSRSKPKAKDSKYSGGLDLSKSFAQLSLPSVLSLQEKVPGQGLTVVARENIKKFTQFGPLQGESILEREVPEDFEMQKLWQVPASDGQRFYLSTVNPEKSNWIRYLRPASHRKQRNVVTLVKENPNKSNKGPGAQPSLYFITNKEINRGEEMVFWTDDPDLMWTRKRAEKRNCGGCNMRFCHPLYYRLHCTVFHDPKFSLTIRKYHCKICGIAVLGKENIVKHAQTEHEGKGAYQCQFCKKHFLRLNYLDMHRTYGCSSNPDRSRPTCDICGKKFCQPQKLKIHLKRIHSGNPEHLKEVQCSICSKILGSKNALQRHKREVHTIDMASESSTSAVSSVSSNNNASSVSSSTIQDASVARVACEKCGRTFKNKSNLKIHMLTHSGVKPFGCKLEGCKSGFTTKQCLQFHYRKAHNLTEDKMPKIEREIPYTLTAYSGGGNFPKQSSVQDMEESRSSSSSYKAINVGHSKKEETAKPEKREAIVNDIYQFNEEEEEEEVQPKNLEILSKKANVEEFKRKMDQEPKHHDIAEAPKAPEPTVPLVSDTRLSSSASLLVEAALTAAEQDMNKGSADKTVADPSVNDTGDSEESEVNNEPPTPVAPISPPPNLSQPEAPHPSTPTPSTATSSLNHSAQSLISTPTTTNAGPDNLNESHPSHHEDLNYFPSSRIQPSHYPASGNSYHHYPPPPSNTSDHYGGLYPGLDIAGNRQTLRSDYYYPSQSAPRTSHHDYLDNASYPATSSFELPRPHITAFDATPTAYRPLPSLHHHHHHHKHYENKDFAYQSTHVTPHSYPTHPAHPSSGQHAPSYHPNPGSSRLPSLSNPSNPYNPYNYF